MINAKIPEKQMIDPDVALTTASKVPLLFLCHRIPYPPNKGDKIRAFHLLQHLSRHFDIYLASFVDDPEDWSGVPEVVKYCKDTFFRPLKPRIATLRSLRGLLNSEALSLPYYTDVTMRRWVARTCAEQNIRHTLVYSSVMAQFLPAGDGIMQRKVIDFVDVDSDKWGQYASQKPWPLSWLYRREARCLLRSEQELAASFDVSLFVSSAEAALFNELSPATAHKTGFYNNGVDLSYFDPHADRQSPLQNPYPAGCQALVFTGAMDYWPNIDAVTWFAHNVLPVLRETHPALAFYIVGSKPTANVQRLARLPGVVVTGRVPDVRPYLKFGLASVAPMRVARGIQNKVLEGMAMALPVIVSRKGLEGIAARHGEHVLLAETVEDYQRSITDILAGRHRELGARARARVQQEFDWDLTLPKVVHLLSGPDSRSPDDGNKAMSEPPTARTTIDQQREAEDEITAARTQTPAVNRGKALVAILSLYCLVVALVFNDTLMSMVSVWMNSETYAHGFLILPISLFLAWRMRDRFDGLAVQPEPWALPVLLGAGLAWLLGDMVDVQLVQRLAFVAILVGGVWAIAGTEVTRRFAFPLGFLFLAVPMGSGLILPLMIFTADTTEYLLRATGVPVFRESLYLYLPTGTWSVIEECSGVRYVIASVTLGLCYAHLNYTSIWRQIAFVAAAVVVPILANSLRAYSVVMIGHLTDMRYGTGLDHLVFGWVLFGVVMLLMFWIGSFWQQDEQVVISSKPASPVQELPALSVAMFSGLALLCVSIWPAAAVAMYRNNDQLATMALPLPSTDDRWQPVQTDAWRWHPPQPGAARELDQVYAAGSATEPAVVGLHLRQYLQQEQGAELVENFNPWLPDPKVWAVREQHQVLIDLERPVAVAEAWVMAPSDNLLVWSWYWIDGHNTTNPYMVKLLEAKQQILEGRRQGTRVFIATPLGADRQQARQVLQDFVDASYSAIKVSLATGIDATGSDSTRIDDSGINTAASVTPQDSVE